MNEFIQAVMFIMLTYPVPALPVCGVLFVFFRYLRRKALSVRTKRIIFGGVAIFCLYPTILSGGIFGIVVPTLFIIVLNLIFFDFSIFITLIPWNIKVFPNLAPFIILIICAIVGVTLNLFKDEIEEA